MANASSNQKTLAHFDEHALAIAKRQYFQAGDGSLADMFHRVANWVASPEEGEKGHYAQRFYELMSSKRFCPGGRVLAGAATSHGNVLNCFVQDGSPHEPGTNLWVLRLATKLALVTKVGGGNGLCLDPLSPKRTYGGPAGKLYLTINPEHPDYGKVKDGTYMDLVHGKYVTRGYRYAVFLEQSELEPSDAAPEKYRYEVGDSVEDIWKAAGESALKLLEGRDVLLDLSGLRAEGTPVNGSGGTSSGPSSFAVEVFDNFATWASLGGADYAGPVATLRYVFAPTLRVIRQGGSRRGAGMATMSITNPDIEDFITAKDLAREKLEGDISTFNISVLVSDAFMEQSRNPGAGETLRAIAEHAQQTGEPGVIFMDRINEYNPMRESLGDIKATNPCFAPGTMVLTHQGHYPIESLVGKTVDVWDGAAWRKVDNFRVTAKEQEVYELELSNGQTVQATAYHTFILSDGTRRQLKDLCPGDHLLTHKVSIHGEEHVPAAYLKGFLVGDGSLTEKPGPLLWLYEPKWACASRLLESARHIPLGEVNTNAVETLAFEDSGQSRKRLTGLAPRKNELLPWCDEHKERLPEGFLNWTLESKCEFIAGVMDADGTAADTKNGFMYQLSSIRQEWLRDFQLLLRSLGVKSKLSLMKRAGSKDFGVRRGGIYKTRDCYRLTISQLSAVCLAKQVTFSRLTSLAAKQPVHRSSTKESRVVAVRHAYTADSVYCCTVEGTHAFSLSNGLVVGQCGEIPLFPGEPCDLGAVNLAQYVKTPDIGISGFDVETFRADVKTCVRFLDNVLTVNRFALEDNRAMSLRLRRLGLGVMGLADALIKMGYRYDSEEGREAARQMIGELREAAAQASETLSAEREAFPDFARSSLQMSRRNVALLTVAPTGTTSMLMGVSSGIEPVFAPFIYRKIGDGYASLVHPLFRELLERFAPHPEYRQGESWDWEKVVAAVQENHGSVQGLAFIPEEVRRVLVCAHDIAPAGHVKMQGAVQQAFDAGGRMVANSISKTINMPNRATVQDVHDAYSLAFASGCKGITVYRDGSREFQVLSTKAEKKAGKREKRKEGLERLPGEPLFVRPGRLTGFTDAVKLTLPTGEKRGFYVTVNQQDGLPSEVFIVSGKAGDEANADSEALGRMVSIALQYGVPAEAIVKTLRGINGGMYGTYQGRMVASKADLLAIALETAGVENVLQREAKCPDCGGPLRFEEGCRKCESCGYSKCG